MFSNIDSLFTSPAERKILSFPNPFFPIQAAYTSPSVMALHTWHTTALHDSLNMLLSYRKWTIPQTFVVRRLFFCRFFLRPSCGRLFPPTRHLATALFHLPQIPFSLCPPSTASSNTRNSKHATLPQATRIRNQLSKFFLNCLGYFDSACGVLFSHWVLPQ